MENAARDSAVKADATVEAKRVIPEVIATVEQGPPSTGGSSPSRRTNFMQWVSIWGIIDNGPLPPAHCANLCR